MDRWRGRGARLAIALALGAVTSAAAAGCGGADASPAPGASGWTLVLRDAGGRPLLRAPLPDGRFTLRYRNSLYDAVAEERFAVGTDGRLLLVALAADLPALLDEYYDAGPPRRTAGGDRREWSAQPAAAVALERLALAATPHGRRTLIIEGRAPIALWELVDAEDPTVAIVTEPSP